MIKEHEAIRFWWDQLSGVLDELDALRLIEQAVPEDRWHRVDRLRYLIGEIDRSYERLDDAEFEAEMVVSGQETGD